MVEDIVEDIVEGMDSLGYLVNLNLCEGSIAVEFADLLVALFVDSIGDSVVDLVAGSTVD